MTTGTGAPHKPIKMISIDDKTLTTDLDRAGYRKMGVFVKSASNYEEARKILATDKIDIILINMDFKPVDGPGLCKHFKNIEETQNIPIVMTSVRTAAKVRTSAIEAGADLFVEQPLPRTAFIERIKQMLEHKTRATQRVRLTSEAVVVKGQEKFSCPIIDLSISGVLLATDRELEDGTLVQMELELPGQKENFQVSGQVVRTITFNDDKKSPHKTGIGIRFQDFHNNSENLLKKYIESSSMTETEMHYYL